MAPSARATNGSERGTGGHTRALRQQREGDELHELRRGQQQRNLKHHWLFLNRLDSLTAVEKLVAFYVEQHNSVMPHAALRSRTPDEVFASEAVDTHERLATAHQRALRERIATNRALECDACPLPRELSSPGQQLAGEERKDE